MRHCDNATIWAFHLVISDMATRRQEAKMFNVQMFKMIFKMTIRHERAIGLPFGDKISLLSKLSILTSRLKNDLLG